MKKSTNINSKKPASNALSVELLEKESLLMQQKLKEIKDKAQSSAPSNPSENRWASSNTDKGSVTTYLKDLKDNTKNRIIQPTTLVNSNISVNTLSATSKPKSAGITT